MFKLRELTTEQYDNIENHYLEQQRIFRLFAIKTKLMERAWQRRCVKHRIKRSKFQGHWHTDWEKIENTKRR
jgi:hypothetical protein